MSKNKKRAKVYRYYHRKRKKKVGWRTYLSSKLVEICIVFLVLLLLMFGFSFYRKLSRPEASEFGASGKEQKKLIFARAQILNVCQKSEGFLEEDVAQKVAERLKRMKVDNIVYQIVEIGKLKDSSPKESLILDRLGDQKRQTPSEVAFLTAEALGIRPRNVIYKKLKDNYQEISLTIVIGQDWKILLPST